MVIRRACLALILSLFLPLSLLPAAEKTPWNGTITTTKTHISAIKSSRDLDQLRELVEVLEYRILKRRAQYKGSADPERQRIQSDIYALEQDLREVRIAIGGSFTLNKTTFYMRDYPMSQAAFLTGSTAIIRADLDGGKLVAKWGEGLLRGRDRWGRFDGALPLKQVETLAPKQQAGDPWAGKETLRVEVTVKDVMWTVDYVPSLPNPWAGLVTTDIDQATYPYQFARVPGLPVRCVSKDGRGGQLVIAVTGIDTEPLEDEVFTNP